MAMFMHQYNVGRGFLAALLIATVFLSACKTGRGQNGGDIEREPPITARSGDAQRQFDDALELLRDGQYAEAEQAFRLLQAEFADDPIADLAEVYVARAVMGPVRLEDSFDEQAQAQYDGSREAAGILRPLSDSDDVDRRVRFAARAYYALELALRGDTDRSLAALSDYPGASLSEAVLESDRAPIRALLTESLHRAERYDVALESAARLHQAVASQIESADGEASDPLEQAGEMDAQPDARPEADAAAADDPRLAQLQSLRALAVERAFGAAERVPDEVVLQDYLGAEYPLLRAAAGWALILEQLDDGVGEDQRAALEDVFNRIAPDLVEVGAAQRAAELSMRLAAVGGPERLAVGFLLPLSGPHQAIGEQAMAGALVAMRAFDHGDYPEVTFVFEDSQAAPEEAFARLEQQEVLAILGPLDVRRARRFAPLARASQIPMITLTTESAAEDRAGADPDGPSEADADAQAEPEAPFVFRNFIDAAAEARAAARAAFENMGDRKATVVYPDVGYGRVTSEAFADEFRALGGQIAGQISYDRTQSDFGRVARRVARSNPEAVFLPESAEKVAELTAFFANENIWGLAPDQRRSTRSNRQQVHYLGTSLWEHPMLIRQAASYVEGAAIPVWFSPAMDTPQVEQFVGRFEAVYGRTPENFEAFSYDTTNWLRSLMLERGMRRAVAIRDALVAGDRHHGVTGPVQMSPNGEPRRAVRFVTPTEEGFEALDFTAVTGPEDAREDGGAEGSGEAEGAEADEAGSSVDDREAGESGSASTTGTPPKRLGQE